MVGGAMAQVFGAIALGPFLSLGRKKMRALAAKPSADDLETVLKLVAEGSVKPVIDRRYPLERANDALKYIQEGHARGKVVIDVETR
jgi:D-arabinose 1-dehydrogenase-like Zn-dependent alcohol dehydrogenase